MNAELSLKSGSPDETRSIGDAIGRGARVGDVILLSGELGAGKTVLVQGVARGLGYDGPVSSKSFVILGEYKGREKLYHADLYRLEDPLEVEDLALGEISEDGVLVVEWPERGDWALPREDVYVRFEVARDDTRTLTISARSPRGDEIVRGLERH